MTCVHFDGGGTTVVPSLKVTGVPSSLVIDSMARGSQCTPPLAKVWYTEAISIGEAFCDPRVIDGNSWMSAPSARSKPSFAAMSRTSHTSNSDEIAAYAVFTDSVVAVRTDIWRASDFSTLPTGQIPVNEFGGRQLAFHLVMSNFVF